MNFDPSSSQLLLGGLIASAAAFWQQTKATLAYISSFVIVSYRIDSLLAREALLQIHQHWRKPPLGKVNVYTRWLSVNGETRAVPFISFPRSSIMIRGWIPSLVKVNDGGVHIHALRGTFHLEEFLRSAINNYGGRQSSSFYVDVRTGEEKGLHRTNSVARTLSDPDAPTQGPSWAMPTPNYYTPLVYRAGDLTVSPSSDNGLFFEPEALELVERCERWKSKRSWYLERSIPWRRGVLLHGPGGTGKSSLALHVAKTLNLPLVRFDLSTMSNREFTDYWGRLPTPCIALLEDIDNVFHGREPVTEHKSLTFDCLLNTISGVQTMSGVLLFVTTNRPELLDPALGTPSENGKVSTRPGRIDESLYVGPMSDRCRLELIKHVLRDWSHTWGLTLNSTKGMMAAQVLETCVQLAQEQESVVHEATNEVEKCRSLSLVR